MAKILVTGGLGLIGHNIVQRLESLGHEVFITDIKTNYGMVPQEELDYLLAARRKKIKTDRIHTVDIADRDGIDWLLHTTSRTLYYILLVFLDRKWSM